MAPTDVEITIAGARDLKNVNWKHGDLCAYAVAWVDEQVKVTTRVDAAGDTEPSWDQKFTLCLNRDIEEARLTIEIYHDKASDPSKAIVGRASLSLMEVVDAGGFDESVDYSLKLKRPSGRPHGKVDISLRLREKRGAYAAAAPPPAYGQNYYPGGQPRNWQSGYPGYSAPYTAQPYGQGYPTQPYPSYPYGAPPPQPSYGAPPTQPSYYNQPPPATYSGSAGYQQPVEAPKQGSKFGGIGTGLAVGALAGAVGGLALGEYVEHEENEAAEEQAGEDAERYAELDAARDDYGGGDDYAYGDDF